MADIEGAVASRFLSAGDVLVLDNASYHTGKGNNILANWLWKYFGVFVMFLPARTPEWNPIELVWATLVKRLKSFPLCNLYKRMGVDSVAYAANKILGEITHQEVAKFYRHCYKGL